MNTSHKTTLHGYRLFATRLFHGISRLAFSAALLLALGIVNTSHAQELDILKKARAYIGQKIKQNQGIELDEIKLIKINVSMLPILNDGREISREYGDKNGLIQYISLILAKPDLYRETTHRKVNNHAIDLMATLVSGNLAKLDKFGPMEAKEVGNNIVLENPLLSTERVDVKKIARAKATAFKELSFYRGLERGGFRVKDLGAVVIDGVSCRKVSFTHADIGTTYEYFEEATGRRVMEEGVDGMTQRVTKTSAWTLGFTSEMILTPANLPPNSPYKQIKAEVAYTYMSSMASYDPKTLEHVETDTSSLGSFDFGSLFK